jgi:hypothetical protein
MSCLVKMVDGQFDDPVPREQVECSKPNVTLWTSLAIWLKKNVLSYTSTAVTALFENVTPTALILIHRKANCVLWDFARTFS